MALSAAAFVPVLPVRILPFQQAHVPRAVKSRGEAQVLAAATCVTLATGRRFAWVRNVFVRATVTDVAEEGLSQSSRGSRFTSQDSQGQWRGPQWKRGRNYKFNKPLSQTDHKERAAAEDFLKSELQFTEKMMKKVLRFWRARKTPPLERIRTVVKFLQEELGMHRSPVRRILSKAPDLLDVMSIESLRQRAEFLVVEAEIAKEDLPDMIDSLPKVLSWPIEGLRPALKFWKQNAGLTQEELREMCKKHPKQIYQKPDNTLRAKLKFLTKVMERPIQEAIQMQGDFFLESLVDRIAPRHFFAKRVVDPKSLTLDEMVHASNVNFCERLSADWDMYEEWLADEWPFSKEAKGWVTRKQRQEMRQRAGNRGSQQEMEGWRTPSELESYDDDEGGRPIPGFDGEEDYEDDEEEDEEPAPWAKSLNQGRMAGRSKRVRRAGEETSGVSYFGSDDVDERNLRDITDLPEFREASFIQEQSAKAKLERNRRGSRSRTLGGQREKERFEDGSYNDEADEYGRTQRRR